MKKYYIYLINGTKTEYIEALNRTPQLTTINGEINKLHWSNEPFTNFSYDVEVEFLELKFDNEGDVKILHDFFEKVIESAMSLATKTDDSPWGIEYKDGENLTTVIDSILAKAHYSNKGVNIIDLAAELIIRVANRHALRNGNKRVALLTGAIFLNSMGYYLKDFRKIQTEQVNKYYEGTFKELMLNVVKWSQNGTTDSKTDEEVFEYVKAFLRRHITISFIYKGG